MFWANVAALILAALAVAYFLGAYLLWAAVCAAGAVSLVLGGGWWRARHR
jgi:hypothetical protein